ncbi:MAG: exonuclease domain-containing protein [Acholeplasmataceae bacterium]
MRRIIRSVDYKKKTFYLVIDGRRRGFYLTNRLAKTFFSHLKSGVLVDFVVYPHRKRIGQEYFRQVAYFTRIISLRPYFVHYDLLALREEMKKVLMSNDKYLFIDFEMTMPGYRPRRFRSEIIQVGYALASVNRDIEYADGFYVLPKSDRFLTRRTKRFLKIDDEIFFKEAVPYDVFYERLKAIIEAHRPKLVVWGKNDLTALEDSYRLHEKKPLTTESDFIDLLKLHKDYYNLKDDLGLFKAYKRYYDNDDLQKHDAEDDAIVTKHVFDAFIEQMQRT